MNNFRKRFKRMLETYKRGGLLLVLERLCSYGYIPEYLFYVSGMKILKLGELNKNIIRGSSPYNIKKIPMESIEEVVNIAREDFNENRIRALFKTYYLNGNECYAAVKNDKVIGYVWCFSNKYVVTWDEYRSKNVEINLQQHQKVLSDLYIKKSYRMKGVYPLLLKYCIDQYNEGTIFFTTILNTNEVSLHPALRLGFIDLGSIINISTFRKNFYKLKIPGMRCSRKKIEKQSKDSASYTCEINS